MKNNNFNSELLLTNSVGLQLTDAIPLISNGNENISLRYTTSDPNHPSYAWFIINGPSGESLRLANKAQLDALLNKNYTLSDLSKALVNELPTSGDIGTRQQHFNTRETKKDNEQEKNEMDSLQTAAEALMTTDPALIDAMDKFFGSPELDPSKLAPKPNFYEIEVDGVTQPRLMNSVTFSLVNGDLYPIRSVYRSYTDIVKGHGTEFHTAYQLGIKTEESFTIEKSVKMSKLGLSFGFNFSALMGGGAQMPDLASKKKALDGANVVREGDDAYKNGKKQDFTFNAEYMTLHAELMVKAVRKMEASYKVDAEQSRQFDF